MTKAHVKESQYELHFLAGNPASCISKVLMQFCESDGPTAVVDLVCKADLLEGDVSGSVQGCAAISQPAAHGWQQPRALNCVSSHCLPGDLIGQQPDGLVAEHPGGRHILLEGQCCADSRGYSASLQRVAAQLQEEDNTGMRYIIICVPGSNSMLQFGRCSTVQRGGRGVNSQDLDEAASAHRKEVVEDADGLGDVGQHRLPGPLHRPLHLGGGCHIGGSGCKVVARQAVAVDLCWESVGQSVCVSVACCGIRTFTVHHHALSLTLPLLRRGMTSRHTTAAGTMKCGSRAAQAAVTASASTVAGDT